MDTYYIAAVLSGTSRSFSGRSRTHDLFFKCFARIQVLANRPARLGALLLPFLPFLSSPLPPSLIRSCHPERRTRGDGSTPATNGSRRRSAQHGRRGRPSGGQTSRATTTAGIRDIFDSVRGGEPCWEKTEPIEAWRRRGTTHSHPPCGVLFRR